MDSPTFPKYQTDYLNFLVNNLEQASDEKKKTENKYWWINTFTIANYKGRALII